MGKNIIESMCKRIVSLSHKQGKSAFLPLQGASACFGEKQATVAHYS